MCSYEYTVALDMLPSFVHLHSDLFTHMRTIVFYRSNGTKKRTMKSFGWPMFNIIRYARISSAMRYGSRRWSFVFIDTTFFFCVFLFLYTCTADNRKWMSMNPSACSVLTAHTHYQIRCIMGISCEWAIPATATNKPLKNARLRNNLVANSIYFTFRYGLLCAPAKCNART